MLLRGERVVLRPFRAEEFEAVLEARRSGPGMSPPTPDARERTLKRLQNSGRLVDGWLDLAIEAEGRLVGEIDARHPDYAIPPGVFELGIAVFEGTDRSRGFGAEAVRLLTDFLFAERIAERVQASTSVDNVAMRRVLERLGFVSEGTMRGFMPTPEGREAYALYGVTREEWLRGAPSGGESPT